MSSFHMVSSVWELGSPATCRWYCNSFSNIGQCQEGGLEKQAFMLWPLDNACQSELVHWHLAHRQALSGWSVWIRPWARHTFQWMNNEWIWPYKTPSQQFLAPFSPLSTCLCGKQTLILLTRPLLAVCLFSPRTQPSKAAILIFILTAMNTHLRVHIHIQFTSREEQMDLTSFHCFKLIMGRFREMLQMQHQLILTKSLISKINTNERLLLKLDDRLRGFFILFLLLLCVLDIFK